MKKSKGKSGNNLTKHNFPKSMGHSKSSSKRKVYSEKDLPQEKEKSQIENLTYHLKEFEKEEQIKLKVSRRKEIIKIREEINKTEIKNNN